MSAPESFHAGRIALYPGDCLATLDALPENSVDSCVCDPPYHLHSIVKRFGADTAAPAKPGKTGAYARASRGFMGKQWDGGDVAFRPETWAKVYRALKPGAYLLAFAGTRGWHRMFCAIEDAGFEIRDTISHLTDGGMSGPLMWTYGSGFPKSHNISKAIDRHFGVERHVTSSASEEAKAHVGFGTALKPSFEPICVARKPLDGTVAANILRWGTGALRIDDCRVATSDTINQPSTKGMLCGANGTGWDRPWKSDAEAVAARDARARDAIAKAESLGRWPPNLVHDGSPEVLALFPESGGQQRSVGPEHGAKSSVNVFGDYGARHTFEPRNDSGSAARFFPAFPLTEADCAFYSAKADADDRLGSRHATVKPVDLMRWLVRLVTPREGLCIDPFAGTGTTGHAALIEGCRAILCEADPEHCSDIRRRMGLVYAGRDERARRLAIRDDAAGPLFDAARPATAEAAE